jgi:hypothetical protein
VAALVERHDVTAIAERGGDRVEPVGVGGTAVKEQDTGRGRAPPFETVKLEAADLDPVASRGLAGQGAAHGAPSYTGRSGEVALDPAHAFVAARALTDRHSPSVTQAALADFIDCGHFARHVWRTRALYAERQAVLVFATRRTPSGLLEVPPAGGGQPPWWAGCPIVSTIEWPLARAGPRGRSDAPLGLPHQTAESGAH